MRRLFEPHNQVRFAWVNLWASLAGLPVTVWLTDEPPVILALSWYAVTVTALGWLAAAQANQKVREDDDDVG